MYLQGAARERGDREIPYGAAQNSAAVLGPEGLCNLVAVVQLN